jgi:hypothetical protein
MVVIVNELMDGRGNTPSARKWRRDESSLCIYDCIILPPSKAAAEKVSAIANTVANE